jgi:hypothetical protein
MSTSSPQSESPVDMRREKEEISTASSATSIDSPFFLSSNGEPKPTKGLPGWLNHFNKKDLKTLFKCSIAVWIATIFMFINPIADSFGTATFFGG